MSDQETIRLTSRLGLRHAKVSAKLCYRLRFFKAPIQLIAETDLVEIIKDRTVDTLTECCHLGTEEFSHG